MNKWILKMQTLIVFASYIMKLFIDKSFQLTLTRTVKLLSQVHTLAIFSSNSRSSYCQK